MESQIRSLFEPRSIGSGRVQVIGCLLISLLASIVLTILLNLLINWF